MTVTVHPWGFVRCKTLILTEHKHYTTCTALASDSVTTSASRFILSGAALGRGISGALSLLIVILLLTTCSIACYWTRKFKKMNHRDQPIQVQLNETDQQLKSDHEFELKGNEAYSSTTHYIPTEDNVAYAQTTQISTKDNVAYGQIGH